MSLTRPKEKASSVAKRCRYLAEMSTFENDFSASTQTSCSDELIDPRGPISLGLEYVPYSSLAPAHVNNLLSPMDTTTAVEVGFPVSITYNIHSELLCSLSNFLRAKLKPQWLIDHPPVKLHEHT